MDAPAGLIDKPAGLREALGWPALGRWWALVCRRVDQPAVIAKLKADSGLTPRYVFMTAMSAGIAVLGLLLSSPAVVIGAMLLSPLMGPILGAGFALAIGDSGWLRTCGRSLLVGVVVAVLFCAGIVLLSPLKTVTEEIASRTRPNLFDLGVALFSALAGAYAMIRGREGTIVGVAIATALMPPLAVIGYGLATANWTVFGGSTLLFFTNLMTIALTAALMAKLYGFRHNLSSRQTRLQVLGIIVTFVALAIPLGYTLRNIAWEANASRTASAVAQKEFGADARISALDLDFHSEPIQLTATVLTPHYLPNAQSKMARLLERRLQRPFVVHINQYRVGTGTGQAESAELLAARAKGVADGAKQAASAVAERVALIAGVTPEQVLIDRDARRADVRAAPLPGATLATWRTLEQRIAASEPGWAIVLHPPASALPDVMLDPEDPDVAGNPALGLTVWAARRIGSPIAVSGQRDAVAKVAGFLRERGIAVIERPGRGSARRVTLSWLPPDQPVPAPAAK